MRLKIDYRALKRKTVLKSQPIRHIQDSLGGSWWFGTSDMDGNQDPQQCSFLQGYYMNDCAYLLDSGMHHWHQVLGEKKYASCTYMFILAFSIEFDLTKTWIESWQCNNQTQEVGCGCGCVIYCFVMYWFSLMNSGNTDPLIRESFCLPSRISKETTRLHIQCS